CPDLSIARPPSASFLLFSSYCHPRDLHSFPTRRSSDLRSSCSKKSAGSAKAEARLCYLSCLRRYPVRHLVVSSSAERAPGGRTRSEEHTSELQSRENLVCRLLLEKKNKKRTHYTEVCNY